MKNRQTLVQLLMQVMGILQACLSDLFELALLFTTRPETMARELTV